MLVGLAQAHGAAVVLVGHVTKQGTLAGPRSLEHLVDTVLTVEGDRHHALRMVRAVKHRFGPTGELGLFEMGEGGLAEVSDPYRMLLGDRRPEATGSSVLPTVEGERAIVVELQALVSARYGRQVPVAPPEALETGRVGLLLAVLEQTLRVRLARSDVFCSVAGGMRVSEPARRPADGDGPRLGGRQAFPVPADLFAFGEVGPRRRGPPGSALATQVARSPATRVSATPWFRARLRLARRGWSSIKVDTVTREARYRARQSGAAIPRLSPRDLWRS